MIEIYEYLQLFKAFYTKQKFIFVIKDMYVDYFRKIHSRKIKITY